jgi:HEAT repeat protein
MQDDQASEVRAGAAYALAGATQDDPKVTTALRGAMMKARPWSLRIHAAASLARIQPTDVESIQVLAEAAAFKKDSWERREAVRFLYELGPRAVPAAGVLAKIVENGRYQWYQSNLTWHALHALARIGPGAKDALPMLLNRLDHDDANANMHNSRTNYIPVDRNMYAYTVARVGPTAVPELLKLVRDADASHRKAVAAVLDGMFGVGVGPAWLNKIEEKMQKRRRAAVIALGYLGPRAQIVLPDLEKLNKEISGMDRPSQQQQWMQVALTKAMARIRDSKAMPIEQMLDR